MPSRLFQNVLIIISFLNLTRGESNYTNQNLTEKNEFICGSVLTFDINGNDSLTCMSHDPFLIDFGFQLKNETQLRLLEPPFTISSEVKSCTDWKDRSSSYEFSHYHESHVRLNASLLHQLNILKLQVVCKNNHEPTESKEIIVELMKFKAGIDEYQLIRKTASTNGSKKPLSSQPHSMIFDPWPIHSITTDVWTTQSCAEKTTLEWSSANCKFNCWIDHNQAPVNFFKCKDLQNCRPYVDLMFRGKCMGIYHIPTYCSKEPEKCTIQLSHYESSGFMYCKDGGRYGHAVHVPIFKYTDASNRVLWEVFQKNMTFLEKFVRLESKPDPFLPNTTQYTCSAPKFLAIRGFIWTAFIAMKPVTLNCMEKHDDISLVETCSVDRALGCNNSSTEFIIVCSVNFQDGHSYQRFGNCSYSTQNNNELHSTLNPNFQYSSVAAPFTLFPCDSTRQDGFNDNDHRTDILSTTNKISDKTNKIPNTTTRIFVNPTTHNINISTNSTDGSVNKSRENKNPELTAWQILTIGIAVPIVFLLPLLIWFYCKSRKQKRDLVSAEVIRDFLEGAIQLSSLNQTNEQNAMVVPYDMKLEITRARIKLESKILGKGNFGKVVKGSIGTTSVAVKMIEKSVDGKHFRAILSELKIMSYVGKHENIVEFIGANTEKIKRQDVYIVLEFCENGNARDYVRAKREAFLDLFSSSAISPLTAKDNDTVDYENFISKRLCTADLIRWSMEIATGMDFIASKNVCHGDLAARNILLSSHLVAKIGDFGLAKQLTEYSLYVQKKECPLPLKWMSIESLRDLEFSIQSDVWSYGITLWELFSLGSTPYPGMEWNFLAWKDLLEGHRMDCASHSSPEIHAILLKCWEKSPNDRPRFAELQKQFTVELQNITHRFESFNSN